MRNRLPDAYALAGDGRRRKKVAAGDGLMLGQERRSRGGVSATAAEYVGRYPIAFLTVALAAGLLLGKWVKRS